MPDYFPPLPGEEDAAGEVPFTIPHLACACIGPTRPGDKLCACERLALEEERPWPSTLERDPEELKVWPDDFRGFGSNVLPKRVKRSTR